MPATQVLSGRVPEPASALDLAGLARLLFFSAGVTRILHGVLFRAAPSAGALYPTELYAVCGPLGDLPAGVYHFEPAEFVLRRLRDGDFRARLAASAAEPAIARLPLCLVLTGIPWRTTWKYGQRGYRHLFWDAGAIVANLLPVAAAAGWGARVLLGFVDEEVAGLVGIGEPEEYPLALVTVEAPAVAEPTDRPPPGPISPAAWPLSRSPRRYPRVSAAQRAGEFPSAPAVTAWRSRAGKLPAQPATRPRSVGDTGPARAAARTRSASGRTSAATRPRPSFTAPSSSPSCRPWAHAATGPPSWRVASPRSGCSWRRSRSALAPPGSPSWTTTSRGSSVPMPQRCSASRSEFPPIGHGRACARPSCPALA